MKKYKTYDIPYFNTFFEYVTHLSKYDSKKAIAQYSRSGELIEHTYKEFTDDIFAIAKVLRERGYEGKHVAVIGENSYDWLVSYLGIQTAGSVAVSIDTEQTDEVIRDMLVRADAVCAFASPEFVEICEPLVSDGTFSAIFPMATNAEGETFNSLCKQGRELNTKLGDNLTPDMDGAIFFTSGTTSISKPVLLTQRNILTCSTESIMYIDATADLFTPLPLYHSYGSNSAVMGYMINGVRITLCGNLKTMVRDMKADKVVNMALVPLIIENIYKAMMKGVAEAGMLKKVEFLIKINRFLRKFKLRFKYKVFQTIKEKAGFPNWTQCIVGGASLSKEMCEIMDVFGVTILVGYGVTENSPIISVNGFHCCEFGSVGQVMPSTEIKFVEDEIWVKGPSVMKGYYKDPESTAKVIENGWLKTGDFGRMDNNGFLFITGRKKNLIVLKNGKKVSPEMLEEKIYKIPLVKEVVVYGSTVPGTDDVKVAAMIYPDQELTEGLESFEVIEKLQSSIDTMNRQLPTYQQIQQLSLRDVPFERTSAKKIKRTGF